MLFIPGIHHKIRMKNHVCNGFTHSLGLKGVISTYYTVHAERVRQVMCKFGDDNTGKVEQVVF